MCGFQAHAACIGFTLRGLGCACLGHGSPGEAWLMEPVLAKGVLGLGYGEPVLSAPRRSPGGTWLMGGRCLRGTRFSA